MDSIEDIDDSLFISDYPTFEKVLLPVINKERAEKGLLPLSDESAMDHFLDLMNEYRKDSVQSDNAENG